MHKGGEGNYRVTWGYQSLADQAETLPETSQTWGCSCNGAISGTNSHDLPATNQPPHHTMRDTTLEGQYAGKSVEGTTREPVQTAVPDLVCGNGGKSEGNEPERERGIGEEAFTDSTTYTTTE